MDPVTLLATCLSATMGCVVVDADHMSYAAYRGTQLVRSGKAVSGSRRCSDAPSRDCRTPSGLHTVSMTYGYSKRSDRYPVTCRNFRVCGARMYYYMRFGRDGEGLHGSDDINVTRNASHGCVRLHKEDARWLNRNLVRRGTRVLVLPYNR